MTFEHFALNVADARAMAAWYVAHLGFRIVRQIDTAPFTRFLADETGRPVIEIYTNPGAPIPERRSQPPLCFHFAVTSSDARVDRTRLEAAGATYEIEEVTSDGSVLVMLRDPWGVPLQLCQRTRPLV